jgi:hypothetical protein
MSLKGLGHGDQAFDEGSKMSNRTEKDGLFGQHFEQSADKLHANLFT